MLTPYKELCAMGLDKCALCGKPLPRKGGWKEIDGQDGKKVKVCSHHPTPREK